jgi:hypothetical protein
MKKTVIRSISLIMALVALSIAPATLAEQSVSQGSPLEGVWDAQVTLTNCSGITLAQFKAREMFMRGGTLASTDNTSPSESGPGFGTWQHIAGRRFTAPFQFYRFNPDGTFAGVNKITRTITVAIGADSYTAVAAFEIYDPNGNLVFSGCGTETATRQQ